MRSGSRNQARIWRATRAGQEPLMPWTGAATERLQLAAKHLILFFEPIDPARLLQSQLVERLNGGDADAVRIDRIVSAIGVSETEGGLEVLRHRAHVANTHG